ncbi:hypothetical protein HY404_02930 [Candidatus Microgenomates bacterium]|nr:hypothetical protein [Candidatus Microgenomates bacterium]
MFRLGRKKVIEEPMRISSSGAAGPRYKQKQPPKPWGKKERMLIVFILLATLIAGLTSWLSNGGGVSIPSFSLPNFSLEIPSQTVELGR